MSIEKTKTINIDQYAFEMVLTAETDGYFSTERKYDLYFKNERIATDVPSIKFCYVRAIAYAKELLK